LKIEDVEGATRVKQEWDETCMELRRDYALKVAQGCALSTEQGLEVMFDSSEKIKDWETEGWAERYLKSNELLDFINARDEDRQD
jgi:hypothetical protein